MSATAALMMWKVQNFVPTTSTTVVSILKLLCSTRLDLDYVFPWVSTWRLVSFSSSEFGELWTACWRVWISSSWILKTSICQQSKWQLCGDCHSRSHKNKIAYTAHWGSSFFKAVSTITVAKELQSCYLKASKTTINSHDSRGEIFQLHRSYKV